MKTKSTVAAMAATVTLLGALICGATSASTLVNTSASHNRHWMTVFTNDVPLTWEWPETATSATLSIVGMNSSLAQEFAPSTSNFLWQPFTGAVPAVEDIYDLTLTFYNSGALVVGSLTSRLAVMPAAFGGAAVDTGSSDNSWSSLSGNVVIPYDGSWRAATSAATVSQLVIAKEGGVTETNNLIDGSGYFGWKIVPSAWGMGTFNLALTFPGTETDTWLATLTRLPQGTIFIVY